MPWITLSVAGGDERSIEPAQVARAAASALGLSETDIVVLQPAMFASWGHRAVITVHGRVCEPDPEADLATQLRRVLTGATGLADDLVHVVRVTT